MPISGGLSGIWDYAKGMFGNEPQQVPNQPGTDQIPQDTQSIEALLGGNPNAANKQAASPVGMAKEDLEKHIKDSFPDSKINIEDLRGDGDHYSATVISKSFEGKSKIQQHKMVYDSLKGKMGNELHALMLKTRTE